GTDRGPVTVTWTSTFYPLWRGGLPRADRRSPRPRRVRPAAGRTAHRSRKSVGRACRIGDSRYGVLLGAVADRTEPAGGWQRRRAGVLGRCARRAASGLHRGTGLVRRRYAAASRPGAGVHPRRRDHGRLLSGEDARYGLRRPGIPSTNRIAGPPSSTLK